MTASILRHLQSLKQFRFFPANKFYWILLCSSAPVLIGSTAVVSVAAPQQIAQAVAERSARPTLKIGSQGDAVSELQAALKILGFYSGAVDGNYNTETASAVLRFKKSAGLNEDGIVDAATWQKLFPSQATGTPSPTPANTASKFPTPTQTSTTTRVVNTTAEPKPTAAETVAIETPEPKPATPKPTATGTSQRTVVRKTTPGGGTQTTTRTQQTTRSQSGNNQTQATTTTVQTTSTQTGNRTRSNNNRTQSTSTRTQQQSTNTTRTPKTPVIQYTASGLPILRPGMRGSEVAKLQERLSRLGYLQSGVDGNFGAATEAAVKAVQQRFGLEADGVVGGATWEIINRPRGRRQVNN
ncbi:MAG: peptidoglycan-binding protein [Heteroscytonema crispum UTEX LB 1556]